MHSQDNSPHQQNLPTLDPRARNGPRKQTSIDSIAIVKSTRSTVICTHEIQSE